MMLRLGTKAETLKSLSEALSNQGRVLPLYYFTHKQWNSNSEKIFYEINNLDWSNNLIVRSSAINEDTLTQSQAGKYESILNVSGKEAFFEAVNKVISSFDEYNEDNQILVQPMLGNTLLSGVAFTLEPSTLGNYYVINYDESGSTSSITSGNVKENKLFYCFKDKYTNLSKELRMICDCLKELELLFDKNNLDVEFAIDSANQLYILQVRALCINMDNNNTYITTTEQKAILDNIADKINRDNNPKPFLYGKKTIFGVMPDWNPAEIIGMKPNPLALSLYREIITDSIWAYQRNNYGYKNLRSVPLMVDFSGLPYIDVRVSFNSFIPKDLDDELSEKLTNYYLKQLEQEPSKHDKVEFDIIFTCYTLDLPKRITILKEHGFCEAEIDIITNSLRKLTNNIIEPDTGLWKKDYDRVNILENKLKIILDSKLDKVSKVYWILEDCKRYGTLPFAGLARAGFIAVQLLKSLISEEIISNEEYQMFMRELTTVSSAMNYDYKNMSKEAFIKKYGHLRPGTYDINSKRYDEAPDLYFNNNRTVDYNHEANTDNNSIFRLSLEQLKRLKVLLKKHGLTEEILGLFDFIKTAIEGREYAKFIFTKSLSEAIKIFGEIGEELGFTKEECSYANINIIKELYSSSHNIKKIFNNSINTGKENYKITKSITLPPVIINSDDVYSFHIPDVQPNYITMKRQIGEVYVINNKAIDYSLLENKIILIPCADPGYDWMFSHNIKGFITMYGGANSHMAIRAAELGIPAVIGIGEKKFEEIKKAITIEIDPLARKVNILK